MYGLYADLKDADLDQTTYTVLTPETHQTAEQAPKQTRRDMCPF
jgi:hypothetical protein